jgi:two-component system response regulator AtoC
LRKRLEDLEDLALHFLRHYSQLYNRPDLALPSPGLLDSLKEFSWPGNIRELENMIKRIILLGGWDAAPLEMLADEESERQADEQTTSQAAPAEPRSLREAARSAVKRAERRMILQALTRTAWNRKRAARELGVSYRSLLYKIKDYTLRPAGSGEETHPPS